MRQFLAVAILGATLAVTASAAFADDRGSDRVVQGSTTFAAENAAPSNAMANEFTLPQRKIADHERQ